MALVYVKNTFIDVVERDAPACRRRAASCPGDVGRLEDVDGFAEEGYMAAPEAFSTTRELARGLASSIYTRLVLCDVVC